MRAHQRMPAARLRARRRASLAPGDALVERARRDDQVVERERGRERRSAERSRAHSVTLPSTQATGRRRSRCRRRSRSTCTRPARPSACPGRDVARGREAGADQPLRQAGVEAAGDRVLRRRRAAGTKARTSNCALARRPGHGADDADLAGRPSPRGRARSASTVVGELEQQPRPSPGRCRPMRRAHRRAARCRRQRAICASTPRSTGPLRRSGGAAKASRAPSRRMRTRPTPHCCTISLARAAGRRAASQAWQLPSVGWPANGSSRAGREDAHAVVGRRVGGRQQEGRLD